MAQTLRHGDETGDVTLLLLAIAGAAGAVSRYGIGLAVGMRSFPWATLGINVTGSYLLGLVLVVGARREWSDVATVPVAVGFLGAFTTFSTLSHETFTMLRTDRAGAAAVYVVSSIVLGVLAACLGYLSGRAVS